jgi:hypothetical protein
MTPNMRFMPYQDAELDITPSCGGERYVRSGPVPAGSDPKTYDAGTIYFSTDGFGGSGTIGELHVEYTVDLINPILPNSVPPVINLNRSKFQQLNLALPNITWTKYTVLTVNSNALGLYHGWYVEWCVWVVLVSCASEVQTRCCGYLGVQYSCPLEWGYVFGQRDYLDHRCHFW